MPKSDPKLFEGLKYRITPNGGVIVDSKSLVMAVRRKQQEREQEREQERAAGEKTAASSANHAAEWL